MVAFGMINELCWTAKLNAQMSGRLLKVILILGISDILMKRDDRTEVST